MARPIKETPILYGAEARQFEMRMMNPEPVSKERQVMTIQAQIDDILRGIEELKKSEGSKFQIKAMERSRKSLQKQLR